MEALDCHFDPDGERVRQDCGWLGDLLLPSPPSPHWLRRGFLLPRHMDQFWGVGAWCARDADSGRAVACLLAHEGHLTLLAVQRPWQGRGVGRSLLALALERDGMLQARSTVGPWPNLGWLSFCERAGARFHPDARDQVRIVFQEGVTPCAADPYAARFQALDWAVEEGLVQVPLARELER